MFSIIGLRPVFAQSTLFWKKGYCVLHIDIYDTSIFSVADLGCLKRCLGGIEGTKIPSFLVGRSVPRVFEKGRDSELYETWRMFKKMVKDNQWRIRKDNIIPKTSIEYRFSIKWIYLYSHKSKDQREREAYENQIRDPSWSRASANYKYGVTKYCTKKWRQYRRYLFWA